MTPLGPCPTSKVATTDRVSVGLVKALSPLRRGDGRAGKRSSRPSTGSCSTTDRAMVGLVKAVVLQVKAMVGQGKAVIPRGKGAFSAQPPVLYRVRRCIHTGGIAMTLDAELVAKGKGEPLEGVKAQGREHLTLIDKHPELKDFGWEDAGTTQLAKDVEFISTTEAARSEASDTSAIDTQTQEARIDDSKKLVRSIRNVLPAALRPCFDHRGDCR